MTRTRSIGALAVAWRAELAAELQLALHPGRCRLCGAAAADGLACERHALPDGPPPPRCARCAGPLPAALPDGGRCGPCRLEPKGAHPVVALGDYRAQPALREWVLAFKHGGRADLAPVLGRLLAALWRAGPSAPAVPARAVLVPIPLHRWRRIERGYDQAARLARAVGDASGIACAAALRRLRATAPQGEPGSVSRAANVRDAFGPRGSLVPRLGPPAAARVRGRDVWLVDDVWTSGATASECARVLRRLGARSVGALVLARAGGGAELRAGPGVRPAPPTVAGAGEGR